MNIKLLRTADFNVRFREHRVDKRYTAQNICGVCKDENGIKSLLNDIWDEPSKGKKMLDETMTKG